MAEIIGVRFQNNSKIYFFDAEQLDVSVGNKVMVETAKGIEFGEVAMGKTIREDSELTAPLKKVIRVATEQDLHHLMELKQHEKEAYTICQRKINDHKLEMKLVSVEAAFDNSKLLFYFTANGRVDFRSLVKDLASVFKTRIELRQIGVRDEAKLLGGLGPCGRNICCGSFLNDFEPVSIKMAKEQNLSLNPTKISGVCGRLMCCLKYEEEDYEQTRKRMPRIGKEVITPDGKGIVNDLNIVKETVKVRIAKGDSFEVNEYILDDIQRIGVSQSPIQNPDPSETVDDVLSEEEANNPVSSVPDTVEAEISHTEPENNNHPESVPPQAQVKNTVQQENRKKEHSGNSNRQHHQQLGKPVKRENRDKNRDHTRKQPATENREVKAPESKNPAGNCEPEVKAQKPRNNWQAQLEKAMQAAEQTEAK